MATEEGGSVSSSSTRAHNEQRSRPQGSNQGAKHTPSPPRAAQHTWSIRSIDCGVRALKYLARPARAKRSARSGVRARGRLGMARPQEAGGRGSAAARPGIIILERAEILLTDVWSLSTPIDIVIPLGTWERSNSTACGHHTCSKSSFPVWASLRAGGLLSTHSSSWARGPRVRGRVVGRLLLFERREAQAGGTYYIIIV